MLKLVFIVTNYNNVKFTEQMLSSLNEIKDIDYSLVVVDNASNSENTAKLNNLITDNVAVIFNQVNVGYFEGLNIGIRYAVDKLEPADNYIIGNNDLVFPNDFGQKLASKREIFDNYPVVSPNICMLDGTPQNPHVISAISKKREFIYDLYHSSYLLAQVILKVAKFTHKLTDRKDELQHAKAQEIYQGYGACYILGPKFFELFNELECPTFLMYEEFFLATQLERKGFKTYYEPSIHVTHHCHASTGTLPGKFRWQLSKNAHKEYRKYIKVWR